MTPPSMDLAATFRPATRGDIPAILEIRLAVRENVLADPTKVTPEICEQYLEQLGRGWVCEIGGRVVAFSYADQARAAIWALFVRPEVEGRGIGTELLRLATEWLFGQGHDVVTLTTSPGTRAERFYLALGWQTRGTTSDGELALALPRGGPLKSAG